MVQQIDIHHELINQCREGNPKAQYQLYNLYSKQMLNISHRIVNDRMEAEDVLQESFINAFDRLESYRGEAINKMKRALDEFVIEGIKTTIPFHRQLMDHPDYRAGNYTTKFMEDFEMKEEVEYSVKDIHRAMKQLPDGYRVIFSLYMFEDMSHSEIADQLDISVNTSKSQLSRARKKMKELMQQNKEDERG